MGLRLEKSSIKILAKSKRSTIVSEEFTSPNSEKERLIKSQRK
jgi:hypothetical protein